MATLSSCATIVLLMLFLHLGICLSSSSPVTKSQKNQKIQLLSKRSPFDSEEKDESTPKPYPLKKKPILANKNQTKLIKPKKTNSTTLIPTISKASNSTKIKFNKTLNATAKSSNFSKLVKEQKPLKSNSTKPLKTKLKLLNATTNSTKSSKKPLFEQPLAKEKKIGSSTTPAKPQKSTEAATKPAAQKKTTKPTKPSGQAMAWMEAEDDSDGSDLMSNFRELPNRLLPDLKRLSTTSKAYLSAANRGIAEGVKPYVGKSFAPKIAPVLSALFLVLPLLLLTLLFRQLRSYLSLQRLLIFIQAYLAIYFATLALTALVTGLEPLRFFYATSPSSYTWTQAVQTMAYMVYLVLQLVDLVAVFSSGGGEDAATGAARALGIVQMVIGLGVGLHYYAAVFHLAVTGEPPRANWRVHAVYAACFLVICACARAERRKKLYEGGEDGKRS